MFLSPLTKLTTYFKTHCSLQRKWLSFLHCQAMAQTSNISVKAKRKGRELGTLPFKHLCMEALCWLTHRYRLLLPFRWQEESFSFDWSNTFWAYQEQRWIWRTQSHASSQGKGCFLKSIIRSWETSQAFSFPVVVWQVFPKPALSSARSGIQQIYKWQKKNSGYLLPCTPTWICLLLLTEYFSGQLLGVELSFCLMVTVPGKCRSDPG